MFHKALWKLNYKQTKFAIWAMWLVSFWTLPLAFWNEAQLNVSRWQENNTDFDFSFTLYLDDSFLILMIIIIGLASFLIGMGRNNQQMDFTFSLPFNRSQIYLSKWVFGIFHIFTALSSNILFTLIIIKTTILNDYMEPAFLGKIYLTIVIAFTAIYTLALFVGTITGSLISQFVLSLIFLFLPAGLYVLGSESLVLHHVSTSWMTEVRKNFIDYMTLGFSPMNLYVNIDTDNGAVSHYFRGWSIKTIIFSSSYLLLFLWLGTVLFKRTKNENNGSILLFEKLKPYFYFSTLVCSSILGGLFIAYMLDSSYSGEPSILLFYLGAIITGVITFLFLRRLLLLKFTWGR